jgi:hypothetical protein
MIEEGYWWLFMVVGDDDADHDADEDDVVSNG